MKREIELVMWSLVSLGNICFLANNHIVDNKNRNLSKVSSSILSDYVSENGSVSSNAPFGVDVEKFVISQVVLLSP